MSWRLDPEALLADALTVNWTTFMDYALSPFNLLRPGRHHISCAFLENTALVATSPGSPGRSSGPSSQHQAPSDRPSEPPKDTPSVSSITLSRVSHLRGQYRDAPCSSSPSTRKTYKSAWGRWSRWCDRRKVDPLFAPLVDIVLCLTEYFKSGAVYSSVNVFCSAISTTRSKLDGLCVC